jgi:hypothetical protein
MESGDVCLQELEASWGGETEEFLQRREEYLIY